MAVERVKHVASHLGFGSAKGRDAPFRKSPDDVVITMAFRNLLSTWYDIAFDMSNTTHCLVQVGTIDDAKVKAEQLAKEMGESS